jgi:hypothetical protein
MQTAVVAGPTGQEIFIDKYGRIKVLFPWDRQGKPDGRSSCWVRVAQIWAGKRWGAFFWPRAGHEVLVAFEEGDPDQPVVVGSLYNAANMPPFDLPSKAAGCGFKSCSVGGDPAQQFNSLVFHDQPGDEHVHVHSESHEVFTSESSRFRRTPGPQVEVVGSLFGLGSGGGGGMIEWPMAAGKLAHTEWAEHFSALFPGSQKYVFGNNHTATLLGETSSHTLGGAFTNIMVDAEDLLFGKLLEHMGPAGALIGGAGGRTTFTAGCNNNLTYSGPALSVTRGESFQYKTESFWTDVTPVGIGVKVLCLLISGAALAGDLCAALMAHTDEHGKQEIPEWATLIATGVSSGLLGLLIQLETKQAMAQAAQARADDAAHQAAQAAKLAAQIEQVSDAVQELAQTADHNLLSCASALTDMIAAEVATVTADVNDLASRTDIVLESDYSITANDLSFTSRKLPPHMGPTSITISAEGDATGTNGFLHLNGSKQALMQSGPAFVKTSTLAGTSKVNIGNASLGEITLQQGVPNLGPAILMNGVAQSLKLAVGPPGAGASIELSMKGISLKFLGWSLEIGPTGIAATVGTSSLNLMPGLAELKGGVVLSEAETMMQMTGNGQVSVQSSGILDLRGAMVMVN